MKFCLRNRQIGEYLQKADEIKMEYRDYKSIPDLFEKYPDKPIIVQIPYHITADWNELELYKRMKPDNLICCISSMEDAEICKDLGIKFYCGFPITTYHELRWWIARGVEYVRLGAPLFFDLPNVVRITGKTPIRAVANVAWYDSDPCDDPKVGTWIRPEDVKLYENYISVIEFEDCDNKKEQALYRIYAEQKNWPGEIGMIISNYNLPGLNRMIPPSFAEKRIRCGHKCQSKGTCHSCEYIIKLADYEFIKNYKETVLDAKEQN